MAKLYDIYEHPKERIKREKAEHWRRNTKNGRGRRFYTAKDLAIIKHDQADTNARKKRGEIEDNPLNGIHPCGCGAVGCFIHMSRKNSGTQEEATKNYLEKGWNP
jgi:hypothetical protein